MKVEDKKSPFRKPAEVYQPLFAPQIN